MAEVVAEVEVEVVELETMRIVSEAEVALLSLTEVEPSSAVVEDPS
jgi:hypothetical protein